MNLCGCDLTNAYYLETKNKNIKIKPIKLNDEDRKQKRKEILKALIKLINEKDA